MFWRFLAWLSATASAICKEAFSGPPDIHPDFHFRDGWYWNQRGREAGAYGEPEYKIQFFFNAVELALLNGCPFAGKFGKNTDSNQPFEFCGFIYPIMGDDREHLEAWATRFQRASVFSFGSDAGGKWTPGTKIRELKSQTLDRNS